jgi:hypothetical protein
MVDRPRASAGAVDGSGEFAPQQDRPARVTIASGFLLSAGAFVALIGLAMVVIGILYQDRSSLPTWADLAPAGLSPVAWLVGLGALAFGIGQAVTGLGVLSRAGWTRATGILLAALGAGLASVAVVRSGSAEAGAPATVFLPVVAGYLYVIWALAAHRGWFADR